MMLFYDINLQKVKSHVKSMLYFHAFWNRELKPELGNDFVILPFVTGKGRYLGMNMGVITNPLYQRSWWGEGEVKVYLDGDRDLPTLNGTGTEDYIGTGWGQGAYSHDFQGCLIADTIAGEWALYRYHIPDPVYFKKDCRVTIQLIGGDKLSKVQEYKADGAPLIPISVAADNVFVKLLEKDKYLSLGDSSFNNGWVNFYRQDDVSATAYFYLDKPDHDLPSLPSIQLRTFKMTSE